MKEEQLVYNQQYYNVTEQYRTEPYSNAVYWGEFFAEVARHIVDTLNPKTVLDAGCALGYLVAALRDLGVEAYGIDVSEYAIANVREDIKPYCMVNSLIDPLPDALPQRYDLVLCIEVLEHLSMENGKTAIKALCKYSDQILFSSSPEDINDMTHINVQQREYWSHLFAQEQFYNEVFNPPVFVSPHAVLYRKNERVADVIANFERFVRQTEAKTAAFRSKEATGRIYFNFGQGESEVNSVTYTFNSGIFFRHKVNVPVGCQSIRLDPVEGYGCLVRNLNIRSDSAQLTVNCCNGSYLDDLLLFKTIDPQLYIEGLPRDALWIEIEAEVLLFENMAWIKLYDSIFDKLQNYDELRLLLEDQSQKIIELEQKSREYWQEREEYYTLVSYERGRVAYTQGVLDGVISSLSWKITKPLRFAKRVAKRMLTIPRKGLRLIKKVNMTLRQFGLKITLRKIKNKLTGKQETIIDAMSLPVRPAFASNKILGSNVTGNPVDPIQTVLVDEPVKRLNLVTDTINSDSLLGGVATALIVATEFANRYGYELRIITRNTETNPLNYENIIRISGIEKPEKVSFYSDYNRFTDSIDFKMEISPDDIFFATSWWSAMAIARTTIRKRFFYIIQEVETFFYNYGGERMLCEQVMQNPNIDFIINSGYLNKYFETHDPQIVENGCYFEPAFPSALYSKKEFRNKERYKLFFYSRPNNPRNLYTVGVEMLIKAVENGIIDTNEWDIYCVGQNSPIIKFGNGAKSKNLGQLSWTEYANFLADVDLGLCLMYTPHPSYPPFDVASSGGVVLSNKMLNKTSFDMCKNVILADLDEESFMQSFKDAVALAKNMDQRKKNYEENTIPRNWRHTLEETISYMKGKIGDV